MCYGSHFISPKYVLEFSPQPAALFAKVSTKFPSLPSLKSSMIECKFSCNILDKNYIRENILI